MKPENPAARSDRAMETSAASLPVAGAEAEWDLIARARARDEDAFRELVDRHRDRAYGLALRILRAPADAEEVAQDAFVRAWLALPRFRGEASFSTWLHRIVARRAFDRAATLRRRRERETAIEAADEAPVVTAGPGAEEVRMRAHRVERLVAGLPEAQRAVVTLFYYEGRSVAQVAGALAMPDGTVKTHLSRARAKLREAWLRHERTSAE